MVGTQGSNPVSVPEAVRTLPFRGRRSRNKVSVGEPADGSFEERRPSVVKFPFPPGGGNVTLRHLIANGRSPFPGPQGLRSSNPSRGDSTTVVPSAKHPSNQGSPVDPSEKR